MGITALRLLNFRGFRDAKLELKPLTVLLGPNSAGKSAFGQALAAMSHAHRVYASTPQASLTPPKADVDNWPVDLGMTGDLRTLGAKGPVRIEMTTRGGAIELGFGGMSQSDDLWLTLVVHPSGGQSISAGLATPAQQDAFVTSGVVHIPGSVQGIDDAIRLRKINEQQWQEGNDEVSVILDGLLAKAATHLSGTSRRFSGVASDELKALFDSMTYLRANRKRPTRGYRDDFGKVQPMGYSGEWTPSVIHKSRQDEVQFAGPPATPNVSNGDTSAGSSWSRKLATLQDGINFWLSHLGLAHSADAVVTSATDRSLRLQVMLAGQAPRDITEIGFGVSQVLPVLTAGLLQSPDSLLVVDLPESHLHPRPQAALADFFCSMALCGKAALVETHSEMFFHRLRLRAAMNPSLMDRIAIYFVDAPTQGECSVPRLVGLQYEDEVNWPNGFLQEAWETEVQIQAARRGQKPGT
jgi:predicted ATPase